MKRKAEKKRIAREAKRNISAAIDRNLRILGDYMEGENKDLSGLDCIREQCGVDTNCRKLLEEAVRVLEETKSSFRSRKLVELRTKLMKFLEETQGTD
jgi:hypothetical protein